MATPQDAADDVAPSSRAKTPDQGQQLGEKYDAQNTGSLDPSQCAGRAKPHFDNGGEGGMRMLGQYNYRAVVPPFFGAKQVVGNTIVADISTEGGKATAGEEGKGNDGQSTPGQCTDAEERRLPCAPFLPRMKQTQPGEEREKRPEHPRIPLDVTHQKENGAADDSADGDRHDRIIGDRARDAASLKDGKSHTMHGQGQGSDHEQRVQVAQVELGPSHRDSTSRSTMSTNPNRTAISQSASPRRAAEGSADLSADETSEDDIL